MSGTEGSRRERVRITPTGVTLANASLGFAIQWAYDLEFYQISGPAWLTDDRWDIQAKTQESHSPREFREMMRSLLADRFKVVIRREKQPKPAYALMTGTGKPKLLPSRSQENRGNMRVDDADFVFANTTMAEFATQLSDFATVDRPVVDKTGMTGRYDFRLDSVASAIRGGEGPSIFTAVSEIGMLLKKAVEPLDIVVVESAAKKPTPN